MTTSSLPGADGSGPALETAVLGGGCFWCIEAVYQHVPGVKSVVSGYAGGHVPAPTYEQVCTGETGHAEVARIEFDPAVLSYEKLLEVFFAAHDPTTLNRQGADEGTQYRSVIFTLNEAQQKAAARAKIAAAAHWDDPIVTQIVPLDKFYPAENYHQDYYRLHPNQGYCSFVIRPKVKKLQDKGLISKDK
ncbi:MAG: peptide-methionine (S)-S-oxide reductase MsrA [Opitutales bacterium]